MRLLSPPDNPGTVLGVIVALVIVGVAGGVIVSKWVTVFSLIFWMIYTLVLATMQIVRQSKHELSSVTGVLLNPYFRFLVFEVLAAVGVVAVAWYDKMIIGYFILALWLTFAVNFYLFYSYQPEERPELLEKDYLHR